MIYLNNVWLVHGAKHSTMCESPRASAESGAPTRSWQAWGNAVPVIGSRGSRRNTREIRAYWKTTSFSGGDDNWTKATPLLLAE